MTLRFIPGVHRVTHRVALHVEQLADPRVNQAEAHVLAYLSESDAAATISDVHRAFAHKRSTLTSILDRLERRGFITRTSGARDRRTFVVGLTPAGRRAARRVAAHLEAFERRALRHVTRAQVSAFQRVLTALDRALDEE
jgi:DNA-binding MarR family transcriptional regulator